MSTKKYFDIFKHENVKNTVDVEEKKNTNANMIQLETAETTVKEMSTYTNSVANYDLGDLISGPIRPILEVYPKTKHGSQNRSFSATYYNNFEWLEYSIQKNAVFCFVCRIFSHDSGYTEKTFVQTGFTNWKKLSIKLKMHASTKVHLSCLTKMLSYESSKKEGSIMSKMSSSHQKQVEKNCVYLSYLIDILLYLAKQGLAFRGHSEVSESQNQGNFKELCVLFSKHSQEFSEIYNQKINHTSWKIQEDIIAICADQVKNHILKEIDNIGMFALMCDEARCYKEEQLSICVRYTVKLQVYERFLGFVNVSSGQDANHIISSIFSFFESNKVNLKTLNIIAQSYDGASVMSGYLGGVQAKIKELYPCAIYTHCMAHRLNLVVVDMCKNIKSARTTFNVLEAIYVHFSRPSNNKKLSDIQMRLGLKKGTVLKICDTRWVCRFKNCEAMLNNFKSVIEFLTIEVDEHKDKDAAQALGILTSIQKPEFIILITILKNVLSIINVLSNKLQSKSATLGNSSKVIQSVITTFENMRCDDEFAKIWQTITKLAKENNIELSTACFKRKRKEPNSLNEYFVTTTTGQENDDEQTDTSVMMFWRRTAYMSVIDTTLANLKHRFSNDSLKIANSIDSFCKMDSNNGLYFIEHYKDVMHISVDCLKSEMLVAKNCLVKIKENFDIDDIKQVVTEDVYPNLYKLLQVAFTIPVSSATCERSFSSMRRIKNWLRTTMTQERFSNLSILNIERDVTNSLDTKTIIDKFSATNRRLTLI